jgi:hypothetical protein
VLNILLFFQKNVNKVLCYFGVSYMVQKWPVKFVLGSIGTMVTLRPLPTNLMLSAHHFTTLAFYFTTLFSLQILSNHVQQSAMEADVGSKEIDHPHKMLL